MFVKRLKLIIGIMLIVAILYLPYAYYMFLRFAVCFGVIYCFAKERDLLQAWEKVVYIIIAIIFNPFLPFYMDRGSWFPIDLGAGALMVYSAVKKTEENRNEAKK